MTTEELQFWEETVTRWEDEAQEMMKYAGRSYPSLSYALGVQLAGLAKRQREELERAKKL